MPAFRDAHGVLLATFGWTHVAPVESHVPPALHSVAAAQDALGVHAVHAPARQAVLHVLPQVPQLLALVIVSTHAPLQLVVELMHEKLHPVAVHVGVAFVSVVLQTVPQDKQLFGSVDRVAQVPLQFVCPDPQQTPFEQICPDAQAWPQLPQLAVSLESVTHLALHAAWPVGQLRQPVPLQKPLAHVVVEAGAQVPAPSQC